MSIPAITLIALVALSLIVVFLMKSKKPPRLSGLGESCPGCGAPFPPEMLEKVKQASAAQVRQTMKKFSGQKVNLKLKVKMSCPKCKAFSEVEIPVLP